MVVALLEAGTTVGVVGAEETEELALFFLFPPPPRPFWEEVGRGGATKVRIFWKEGEGG